MALYKLLRGKHAQGFFPKGHPFAGQPITYEPGDIIESPNNLLGSNGNMDARTLGKAHLGDKFELVTDDRAVPTDKINAKPATDEEEAAGQGDDGLDKMNVTDLRKLAEGDDIDLGQARTKPEIIAAIRAAYAPA